MRLRTSTVLFAALALAGCARASGPAALPAPGGPDQLGGQLSADGRRVSFRVFSAHASRLEVHLFRRSHGAGAVARYPLIRRPGTDLWELQLPAADLRRLGFRFDPRDPQALFTTIFYGYRAWGPNWPWVSGWQPGSAAGFRTDVDSRGHRFNPNKLLLDPYALEVSHDVASTAVRPPLLDPGLFASGGPGRTPVPDRQRDSGPRAPKGVVAMPWGAAFSRLGPLPPLRPGRRLTDEILYEVHLRGLSRADPAAGRCRGTYAGAIARLPYLRDLGITAVQFLPIHETENGANDLEAPPARSATGTAGDNYWGYMSSSFFAPDRRYSCDQRIGGPTREFAAMVRAFHRAGIRVVTDVVVNHTGEGGLWGGDPDRANLWSLRGLDNASYYLLNRAPGRSDDRRFDFDITGTGNTLNTRHPQVGQLILDSLRYQRQRLGVWGFRFDLAIALANRHSNTSDPGDPVRFRFDRHDPHTALARVIAAFPGVFLSGEPWGLAPAGEGYQLGAMPAGFSEWNGGFRDVIRRSQNKVGIRDADATPARVALRLAGSPDLYDDPGDGRHQPAASVNLLTVHDGFTLHDLYACNGQALDQPWPWGPGDGGSADEDSWDQGGDPRAQRQAARTGFALLLLAAGVPIINGGDEHLRSLRCHNNPYNLDSPANWLQWSLNPEQRRFHAFARALIHLRRRQPALRPARFPAPPVPGPGRSLIWLRDGTAAGGDRILMLLNSDPAFLTLPLPDPGPGRRRWCRLTDTAAWAEGPRQVDLSARVCVGSAGSGYGLHGRSLVLLVAR